MAGHDLRQTLQCIAGVHEWLTRRFSSGREREYLRRGGSALAQLTHQLDLLVEAVRMHEQSVAVRHAPVMLGPLLNRLCSESKDLAEQRSLMLNASVTRGVVIRDALLLQGVLRNLIGNAVKYTRPGGRVLVGCRRRGALVRVEVRDNGIGIPSDKLLEIFDAFRRLDSTRADGFGVGLFVVRRAVRLLNHEIDVRSEIGRGSCFSVLTEAAGDTGPEDRRDARDRAIQSPRPDVGFSTERRPERGRRGERCAASAFG